MSYKSFWLLHRKLSPRIAKAVDDSRRYKRKGGRGGGNYKLPPVRNGPITTCIGWLVLYGIWLVPRRTALWQSMISKKSVSESVWVVVEAVNNLDESIIEYTESEEEVQLEIA